MSFKETYEKITKSEVFKTFIDENLEAELCAGFFILDFMSNDSKKSLDYKHKDKISSFGIKGESYDTILKRVCSLAVKEHLRNFLMSDEGFIPIEEAIKEADKEWSK